MVPVSNGKDSLSIIIPVYNEAGIIEDVVRDIYSKVIRKIPGSRLIIVEDGSADGTKEILNKLSKEISFVLISGEKRKGYAKAFKDALNIVETKLLLFSDSDGQHEPEDVFRLLKEIDKADIVSGWKHPRHDPLFRIVISKIYNFLIQLLFGLKIKDINSGFKLIKKKVVDDILKDVTIFKYCVISEFILKAHLKGYKVKEIPIKHYSRKSGATTIFTPRQLSGIICTIIKDLLQIKFIHIRVKSR